MIAKPIINLATKYTGDIVGPGVRNWVKTTNIEGLRFTPKTIGDTTKFVTKVSNATPVLTNMTDDFSREFNEINKKLIKASQQGDFLEISKEINRLPNSTERDFLMEKFLVRYKVFKDPFIGIQKNLSEIFGRELSDIEMTELCKTYKEIFKEQDNLRFTGKLYYQVMKDFGFNTQKIRFSMDNVHPTKLGSIEKTGERAYFYIGNEAQALNTVENRIKFMNVLVHELTHLKQNIIAYGTSSEAYIEALARHCQKKGKYQDKNLAQIKEILQAKIEQGLLIDAPKFDINSAMGQKGIKYINGNLNYKSSEEGKLEYMTQLIEKEAFEAGDMAEQAIRYILAGLV